MTGPGAAARGGTGVASGPVIELQGIGKVYQLGAVPLRVLDGVQLEVRSGEMVAIMGPSGSGKSTLMNLLGCLDRPTEGTYRLGGRDVARLGDDQLATVRNRMIGFVFQNYGLLPRLSALQNVELPLIYRGDGARRRRDAAMAALDRVGLAERFHHRPSQLSGGQQQRVAVARALAGHPEVLLADEPTGNLDTRSGRDVMALLQELNAEGVTIVLVTHDPRIARYCARVVRVLDGRVQGDEAVTDRLIASAEGPGAPAGESA